MKKYRVVKILGGEIIVSDGDKNLPCVKTGNLKKSSRLCVGDFVEIKENTFDKSTYIIDKILHRKNQLIRPNVANIDRLVIVTSIAPLPDFYLIDNLICYCFKNDIVPMIVVNKCDLMNEQQIQSIVLQYKSVVSDIVVVSAKNEFGIDSLRKKLAGKFSALAGQSAVGKSSLINALCPDLNLKSNGLSEKILRGKHTTRHHEIFSFDNMLIADTPGFSMFELNSIKCDDLHTLYPDFAKFEQNCKYGGCTHINCDEKNCGVVSAVKNGQICLERYQRYCKIYNDLKLYWRDKYD